MHRATTIIATALMATGLWACDEPADTKAKTPTGPPANVNLPEPPPASAFVIPEKNGDGTLRVEGIIENREKYLEKKVDLRGTIAKVSQECDPKKAKEDGVKCEEPHFYVKDSAEGRQALLVVGFDQDFLKRAELAVGGAHLFKGTYQKVAQGFAATETGLILLDAVDETMVLEEEPAKKKKRKR